METCSTDTKVLITPDTKKRELFGKKTQILDELRVTKRLCAKEHRSFLFSNEVFVLLQEGSGNTLWYHMLAALRHFAGASLFVVNNRGAGLSTMETELPVIYRKENSLGQLKLPLDQPAIIPAVDFSIAREVISTINVVLSEVIPGLEIELAPLGKEFTKQGGIGIQAQLVRTISNPETNETIQLPLKYESEGIKKIISILHLFICAYNSPGITLAIDELDSGIYEYLLGELLHGGDHGLVDLVESQEQHFSHGAGDQRPFDGEHDVDLFAQDIMVGQFIVEGLAKIFPVIVVAGHLGIQSE